MGKPRRNDNVTARARAYEMYVAGIKKSEIAKELGVTRMTITNWATKDAWQGRLDSLVDNANQAADFATSDLVTHSLMKLKGRLAARLQELELLCGPINHPTIRLRAIQLWFKLAGVDKAMPDPIKPGGNDLQLVEDILEDTEHVGRTAGGDSAATD